MEDMMVAALAVGVLVDAAAIAYFAQLDLDCWQSAKLPSSVFVGSTQMCWSTDTIHGHCVGNTVNFDSYFSQQSVQLVLNVLHRGRRTDNAQTVRSRNWHEFAVLVRRVWFAVQPGQSACTMKLSVQVLDSMRLAEIRLTLPYCIYQQPDMVIALIWIMMMEMSMLRLCNTNNFRIRKTDKSMLWMERERKKRR